MPTWQRTGLGSDFSDSTLNIIKDYIKSQWTLTGDLDATNPGKMKWGTGWYDAQPWVQLHFRTSYKSERAKSIGQNYIHRYDDFIIIHVFVETQTDNVEPAQLDKIYRELDRIVGSNTVSLEASQGIQFMKFIQPMRTMPQEANETSLWHGIGVLMIAYHKVYA